MEPLDLVRSFPVAEGIFYHGLKYNENVSILRELLPSLEDDQFVEIVQRIASGEPFAHILRELGMFPQPDEALVDIFSAAAEALYGQGTEAQEGEATEDAERRGMDGSEIPGVHPVSPEASFNEVAPFEEVRDSDEDSLRRSEQKD
jgi:hypothetical protein